MDSALFPVSLSEILSAALTKKENMRSEQIKIF